MEETRFEPQYPVGHYVAALFAGASGIGAIAACAGLGLGRPWVIVSVVLLGLALCVLYRSHVRGVTFGENMVVVRMLLGDRYCNYREILYVNQEFLWTSRQRVRIADWLNQEAFLDMLRGLYEQGRLDKNVFAAELLRNNT